MKKENMSKIKGKRKPHCHVDGTSQGHNYISFKIQTNPHPPP